VHIEIKLVIKINYIRPCTFIESTSKGLPKLVMQTWRTEKMSNSWSLCRQSLLNSLPRDWTYVFITDESMYCFVQDEFPELYDSFLELPHGVQKADVLRYLWLYKFGGVYLDLDYNVLKDFTKFIEDIDAPLSVLHSANTSFILTNSFIVAKKGLIFFYNLAQRSCKKPLGAWWSFTKHTDIMTSTGPLAFDNAVRQSGLAYCVLPNRLFLPDSPVLSNDIPEKDAFMIAVEGGTWNSFDTVIFNFVNKYKAFFIFLVICGLLSVILDRFIFSQHLYFLMKRVRNLLKKRNKNAFGLLDSAITEITANIS